jgi:hypothetical protein
MERTSSSCSPVGGGETTCRRRRGEKAGEDRQAGGAEGTRGDETRRTGRRDPAPDLAPPPTEASMKMFALVVTAPLKKEADYCLYWTAKTGNDVRITKSRTGVILFSKSIGAF